MICQRCKQREATERIHKTTVNLTGVEPRRDESVEELCAECVAGVRPPSQPSPADYIEFIKQQVASGVTRADAIKQAAKMLREQLGDEVSDSS